MSKNTKIAIIIIIGLIIGLGYFAYSISLQQDLGDKSNNPPIESVQSNDLENDRSIQATESTNVSAEEPEQIHNQKLGWKDEQIVIPLGENQSVRFTSSIPEEKKWEDVTAWNPTPRNWHGLLIDMGDTLDVPREPGDRLIIYVEQLIDDETGESLPVCYSYFCEVGILPNMEMPEGWEYLERTAHVTAGANYGYYYAYKFLAKDKSFVVYVQSAVDLISLETGYLSEVFKSLKFIEM
ncbi:MAG TPA: hypothetical protein PKA42_02670 [Candidatus Paceibacterota bacterium]|nr:hypothetical protein [Candidatus Paceibacterota bacterium]HMO83048.1 hypothetical protein [Candidatus Paceibacterota bacterium]